MTIGPQLPPSLLEKRKRDDEDESDSQSGSSSDSESKRRRTVGPTLPTAPLDQRPAEDPPRVNEENDDQSSSSEDDDFGPALPSKHDATDSKKRPSAPASTTKPSTAPAPVQRDEWMTMAPASGDWSSRVDPTKLKSRGFNTSKSRQTPSTSGSGDGSWHETPEEKQARLQREMMGIKDTNPKPKSSTAAKPETNPDTEATAKRMKEYSAARGPSLFEAHANKTKEEDDDPSTRAFSYEKDMAGGMQINATQRRDMVKKAGDFGSRFSSAKYL